MLPEGPGSTHPLIDGRPGIEAWVAHGRWGTSRMRAAIEELPAPLGLIQTPEFRRASTIVEERESTLPALRFTELDGLSHWLMLEDPDRCNSALRSMALELARL
jgi:pimeloyl-ACP methyl ester carboxylesterase